MTNKNLETVQSIYEAFGRGDVPRILEQLRDDVVWDQDAPSYGMPLYAPGAGKEHVVKFFGVLQELEFLRFEPKNFLCGGDQVAVPVDIELRVKATGKVAKALEIHLWTLDADSKVARFFHCLDRHAFLLAYDLVR